MASFACFRLAELVAVDDGPFDILAKARAWFGAYDLDDDGHPKMSIGRGIICPYCVGIWIAAALALMLWPVGWMTILYALAIAGGQAFLQHTGGRV